MGAYRAISNFGYDFIFVAANIAAVVISIDENKNIGVIRVEANQHALL